jgi:O-methyltransferase
LAAARAGLAGARDSLAAGPGPDAEALRIAYLDLLKLCLCDLTGATSVSVSAVPGGGVVASEISGYLLRLRSAGMDWPLQGLTMTGLARLDDLQSCVESIVADGVEGDVIEAGAWRGGSSILMKATLEALGDRREVVVADSFAGFPDEQDEDRPEGALSTFEYLAVSEDEVRANFARFGLDEGVTLVPGFFQDTLPGLSGRTWAIVRLDGDTYEATRVGLESLYPGLSEGGYLVIDDYGAYEECRKAVEEFRAEHDIGAPIEAVDWTCVRWRKGEPATAVEAGARANGRSALPVAAPARPSALQTTRELELAQEAEALRSRLAAAEAEVGRMRRTLPWRAAARLRRTLGGGAR